MAKTKTNEEALTPGELYLAAMALRLSAQHDSNNISDHDKRVMLHVADKCSTMARALDRMLNAPTVTLRRVRT